LSALIVANASAEGWVAEMADVENGHAADDDAAAREAAEVAVELTETDGPEDKNRIAKTLQAVAGIGAEAVRRGGNVARTGGGLARRGADTATGTVVRGAGNARRGADTATGTVVRGVGNARRGADTATGTVVRGVGNARRGVGSAGRGVSFGLNWLTGQVVAMGPRLRIRDQATLRARFPGRSDDEIAGLLVERAARATATVGGATGAWAALPALPAFPAEVAAETLAVVGIEIKLVAELHEIYGMPATGSAAERARAYVGSWASRRGVYQVDGGLLLIAGSPLARQLTRRLAARVRRSAFSLSPLLTGALAGALLNRRETKRFGRQIRDDLRQRRNTVTATVIGRPTPDPTT
jgi:hypothetical protein